MRIPGLKGRHQGSAHAFHGRVVGGGIHHPAIGFLERVDQRVGVGAHAILADYIPHGFRREFGGMLAGLSSTHSVGHEVEPHRRHY